MDSFQVHPIFPLPLLLTGTLLALVVLIYFEFKRMHKFLLVRIILQTIVIGALLGLALKPKSLVSNGPHPVLLLTEGFAANRADSLLQSLETPEIYHLSGIDRYKQSIELETIDVLAGQDLYVVGNGISYYDVPKLEVASFHYFPTPITGLYSLINDSPYTVHQTSWIKGTIRLDIPKTKLILDGPQGSLDSMTFANPGLTSFMLRFTPKAEGKYLFPLTLKDSIGETLFSTVVPVRVAPERKLKILVLQDFPSVETRFLKNFLGGKGHSLALRSGVSQKINQSEFINMDKESLDGLSTKLISQFDLLILHDATYANLSTPNQRLLANAVREGLGIIILVDELPSQQVQELLPVHFTKTEHDTVRIILNLDEFTSMVARVAPLGHDGLFSVLSNGEQILAGYVLQGGGRVGFQLMNETYSLLLQDKEIEFAEVWTPLLGAVAREEKVSSQLKIITPFPWSKDEPLEVEVLTQEGVIPELMFEDRAMPLLEDSRLDDRWTTTIWPSQEGWNSLTIKNDSTTLDFYVSKEGKDASLRNVNQMEANRFYAAMPSQRVELTTVEEEVSPLLFFVIFLLATGALWLLPKL